MSVTNLSPDSIRWTAFLSISRPTTCNLSESSRCEIWSAFRSSFTLSPDMLLRPSAGSCFEHFVYLLFSVNLDIGNSAMIWLLNAVLGNTTCHHAISDRI